MARDLKLDTEIGGVVPVVAGFDRMAKAVDNVGDQAKQTERELSRLSAEISKTEAKMALLTKQFNETGDSKFVKEFGQEKKSIAGLREMQGEIDRTEAKARKAERALAAMAKAAKKTAEEAEAKSLRGRATALLGNVPFVGGPLAAIGPEGAGGIAAGFGIPAAAEVGGLAAAGGLLTAGLGGIAAGIAGAAQQQQVKDAFSTLIHDIGGEFKDDTQVFVQPLVDSANVFGQAWRRQEPGIKATFADLSKDLVPLTQGATSGLEKVIQGVERAARASGPILAEFGSFLDKAGAGIGDVFTSISSPGSVAGAVDALRDLGDGLKFILDAAGDGIKTLSELNHIFHEIDTFGGHLPSTLSRSADAMKFLNAGSEAVVHVLGDVVTTVAGSNVEFGHTQQLTHLAAAGTAELATEYGKLNTKLQGTVGLMHELSDEFDKAFGAQLSLAEANVNYRQSVNDLTKSIHDNGKSFDTNTEKGQANERALIAVLRAAEEIRQQQIATGTAIPVANAAFQAQVAALRALLLAAHLTAAQVDGLLASWIALAKTPDITKTLTINGHTVAAARASGKNVTRGGPAIPAYAEGGLVGGPVGAPQLAIVHGGEYVVPRVRGGMPARAASGGGGPVNVNVSTTGTASQFDEFMMSWFARAQRLGMVQVTVSS